jgi:hypothetical protein
LSTRTKKHKTHHKVGPEPTTDRFVVVQHGLEERRTPGE